MEKLKVQMRVRNGNQDYGKDNVEHAVDFVSTAYTPKRDI